MDKAKRVEGLRAEAAERQGLAKFWFVLATASGIAQGPVSTFVSHVWGDVLFGAFIASCGGWIYNKIVQLFNDLYADWLEYFDGE